MERHKTSVHLTCCRLTLPTPARGRSVTAPRKLLWFQSRLCSDTHHGCARIADSVDSLKQTVKRCFDERQRAGAIAVSINDSLVRSFSAKVRATELDLIFCGLLRQRPDVTSSRPDVSTKRK